MNRVNALAQLLLAEGAVALAHDVDATNTETFTLEFAARMDQPCVYLFINDGRPVYVGYSANGIFRALSPFHHKASLKWRCDEIQVLWCKCDAEARSLEKRLIRHLQPKFNGRAKTACGIETKVLAVLKRDGIEAALDVRKQHAELHGR